MALRGLGEGMNDPEALSLRPLSPRHERRLLAASGFPPPYWWVRLGRILPAILELQREPELSLNEVAKTHGFARGVEFGDCLERVLGLTPGEARRMLGWEGLVCRGLPPSDSGRRARGRTNV